MLKRLAVGLVICGGCLGQGANPVGVLANGYLRDLIKLDTSNPPGNESLVARYLKRVADQEGISAELLGPDPARLNLVARLKGSGNQRPRC